MVGSNALKLCSKSRTTLWQLVINHTIVTYINSKNTITLQFIGHLLAPMCALINKCVKIAQIRSKHNGGDIVILLNATQWTKYGHHYIQKCTTGWTLLVSISTFRNHQKIKEWSLAITFTKPSILLNNVKTARISGRSLFVLIITARKWKCGLYLTCKVLFLRT